MQYGVKAVKPRKVWAGCVGTGEVTHVSVSEEVARRVLDKLPADKVVLVCRVDENSEWETM